MVNSCTFYRYIGKTIPSQNLKHNQLVLRLFCDHDKVKFQNQRTGATQYISTELWKKYFVLASDKYKN